MSAILDVLKIKDQDGNWHGIPGLKGDTGEPFKPLGIFPTVAAMQAAVENPGVGDCYLVGTTDLYYVYVYQTSGWVNAGRFLQKGDKGDSPTPAEITAAAAEWLSENVDPETGYVLDTSLSVEGAAADAGAVGDLKNDLLGSLFVVSSEQTGRVVDFDDGAGNIPFEKLTVDFPYNENGYTGVDLYRTALNVWGGDQMRADFKTMMPAANTNTPGQITFESSATNNNIYPVKFKENTRYKIILTLKNNKANTNSNLRCIYTDGTVRNIDKASTTEKQTVTIYSITGKTLRGIAKVTQAGSTTIYTNESGVFEYPAHSSEYVGYNGEKFSADWSEDIGVIYGGTLDVISKQLIEKYDASGEELAEYIIHTIDISIPTTLDGYNVLWSSTGDVTEKHRLNVQARDDYITELLSQKQDALTFDDVPTQNSDNPVKSGGVYSVIDDLESIFTGDVDTAVSNWLAAHPEATTTVTDNSLTSAKMAAEMKSWIRRNVINVKDYGATGDGTTDDSRAILDALHALPINNGVLYFPPGVYIHGDGLTGSDGTGNDYAGDPNVGRNIQLMFNGYTNLSIIGDSAEIRSNDNNGECPNNAILNLYSCSHVVVRDITLNGRREERGCHLGDGNAYNRRGNIHIYGCDDIVLDHVRSINSAMDGAYLGKNNAIKTTNVTIINCDFSNAYRNGLSVGCGEYVYVENTVFDKAGTNGGINPKAGIDVEADYGVNSPNKHVTIKNCRAIGCAGISAIAITVAAENVLIDGCITDNVITSGASNRKNICIVNNLLHNTYISSIAGGIVAGNKIIYDAASMQNGEEYSAIISEGGADLLLIQGNMIYCDAENIPENTFCNLGLNISNANAVVYDNVFENPLWGQGETAPIIINAKSERGNVFWQKTIPDGYNEIVI